MSQRGERLYHYTDDKGIQGIQNSQRINPSTDTWTDAMAGEGVYFTSKGPKTQVGKLLQNNYDGMNPVSRGRVEHSISIQKNDLPHAQKVPVHGRDVYVNPGPVDLTMVDYKVHHKNVNKK